MKKENFELSKWLPICIIAIILMLIYKTIDNIAQITTTIGVFLGVISPLLLGIIFAYFLYIPHHLLERVIKKIKIEFIAKHSRGVTTIIVFVILLILLILILSFVIPILFANLVDLATSIPEYIISIMDYFDNLPADSIYADFNLSDAIRTYTNDLVNMVINIENIELAAQGVISFLGGLFSTIMGLVISLYLLLDRDRIFAFFRRLNIAIFKSELKRHKMTKYVGQINNVLLTFITSKGLDSVINFIVATAVLLIFGVQYALLLGLIAGAFNFIPYIGSIISALIISLLTLITSGVDTAIYVLICLLIFNQIDGNYIEPRIMKSSLKISPILVIVAVVIGGAYFGIVGMFLAVPIAVIIKQIMLEYMTIAELHNLEEDKKNKQE
ncbi:MAG: AI-2E family transporter [Oscillospiraceae bacterium]|nr:AI-2E family transporter [Oscillospiraceae bacterium]